MWERVVVVVAAVDVVVVVAVAVALLTSWSCLKELVNLLLLY